MFCLGLLRGWHKRLVHQEPRTCKSARPLPLNASTTPCDCVIIYLTRVLAQFAIKLDRDR